MAEKIGDSWFEYVCPVDGIDFDVEPMPIYGSELRECFCGQKHQADEKIGRALRIVVGGPDGEQTEDFTTEWSGKK